MSFRTSIFAIPYSVFQGFSIFQSIASNTLPELQHNSQTAPKCLQDTPKILPRASQDPFLEASRAPTSLSWCTLGCSWLLLGALGRSWDALGTLLGRSLTLLDALGRSWDPLGTPLARFRDLQGWILVSPGRPKRTKANIPKVDRKLSKNCPRRVRKPNPSALYSQLPPLSIRQEAKGRRSSRSELNKFGSVV